jgi:L-sorbose 1-phosphate reductase
MMTTLEQFKAAETPIPQTMTRWHLYGAGLENLGRDGKPETVPVPAFGDDEILVRQDACGLCFSDTKVIGLGAGHPRLTGRDMQTNPVTLGHEVACTVVGVGKDYAHRFNIGDRFVIQADVFYQGQSMAYGYVISGGLAEYSVIGREIIDGDEGCYLLPIQPETGYVESALTEPWACVVSAYAQEHRDGIKNGGTLLYYHGAGSEEVDWSALFSYERRPERMFVLREEPLENKPLLDLALNLAIQVSTFATFAEMRETFGDVLFDDILFTGVVVPETVEALVSLLANHGIVNFIQTPPFKRKLSLDIGRIHYNWHFYLGTDSPNPADAYAETRTAELLPEGACWIIGAGGPMGQMHVQRAVQLKQPPKLLVCSDVDAVRLQSVADRFGNMAQERGIQLVTLNPNEIGQEAFNSQLHELTGGRGYDDIVSMVPVAAVIEHAADYLAPAGWFNIFAGVARGTMANLDVNRIIQGRARYLGSSGSSLADMRETLSRVEADELSTNASLAAIGGMEAAAEGLKAVKEGWFPGKTLIFPHIHNLPLTPLAELKNTYPTVYAKLKDGQFWTQEAEDELLRLLL